MPFVAAATRSMACAPEVAFDQLADYGSWGSWMPRSFRPVGARQGPLRVGDRLRVRIAGAPFPTVLEVTQVDRPREIAWRGGARGILGAEHRFVFEKDGEGATRVRSVEVWYGALAPLARFVVKRIAERIGEEQLAGLARALQGTTSIVPDMAAPRGFPWSRQ